MQEMSQFFLPFFGLPIKLNSDGNQKMVEKTGTFFAPHQVKMEIYL